MKQDKFITDYNPNVGYKLEGSSPEITPVKEVEEMLIQKCKNEATLSWDIVQEDNKPQGCRKI